MSQDLTGEPAEAELVDAPTISPGARTRIYVGLLVANVSSGLSFTLLSIFGVVDPVQAVAAGGAIAGATGVVSQALAIGYRPTRFYE